MFPLIYVWDTPMMHSAGPRKYQKYGWLGMARCRIMCCHNMGGLRPTMVHRTPVMIDVFSDGLYIVTVSMSMGLKDWRLSLLKWLYYNLHVSLKSTKMCCIKRYGLGSYQHKTFHIGLRSNIFWTYTCVPAHGISPDNNDISVVIYLKWLCCNLPVIRLQIVNN